MGQSSLETQKRPQHGGGNKRVLGKRLPKNGRIAQQQESRGLPRPKSQISYSIPQQIRAATTTTPSGTGSDAARSRSSTPSAKHEPRLVRLSKIQVILDLIHRRNKNQHRNQIFWKWLCLLRRSIGQLVTIHQRLDILQGKSAQTSGSGVKADAIRKTFEVRAELRSQCEVHEEWLRETLVPGCYVAFSSVLANNQFANLGVVLMSILGDVAGLVGAIKRIDKIPRVPTRSGTSGHMAGEGRESHGAKSLLGVSTLVTGPDQGEVIERIFSDEDNIDMLDVEDDLSSKADEGVAISRAPDRDIQEQPDDLVIHQDAQSPFSYEAFTPISSAPSSIPDPATNPSILPTNPNSHTVQPIPSPPSLSSSKTTSNLPEPHEPPSKKTKPSTLNLLSKAKISSPLRTTPAPAPDTDTATAQTKPQTQAQTQAHTVNLKTKKKKKKGNAIDDLFGGMF